MRLRRMLSAIYSRKNCHGRLSYTVFRCQFDVLGESMSLMCQYARPLYVDSCRFVGYARCLDFIIDDVLQTPPSWEVEESEANSTLKNSALSISYCFFGLPLRRIG